jgi:endonuclease-3
LTGVWLRQPSYYAAVPHPPAPAQALEVWDRLRAEYPDARTRLDHRNPFELLVATVLSAQTTDDRVNTVTPELFRRWPAPEDLAGAPPAEVEAVIRPLGFQHRRAGQVVGVARALCERFEGEVPHGSAELESLPGVGRKTANVVRGNCFGIPALTVDTHVGRLSRRLGWTLASDPGAVERDVCALMPEVDWTKLSHVLIWHGRAVCHARRPACERCVIADLCPSAGSEN